jgi:hypothetical protein
VGMSLLTSVADVLTPSLQSSKKGKQNSCSAPRVLTEGLKKLSYTNGAIFIPKGKEGRKVCITKFDGKKPSKNWLAKVGIKLKNSMKLGMSKEKAFYKAMVEALREKSFKYKLLSAPGASVIPPSEFLKGKIGDCSEFAALIAATAKAFNLDYIYVYNSHHIFSAIVLKEGDKKPADLKPIKIKVSARAGAPPTTLYIYPIDVTPPKGRGALVLFLNKALSGVRKWIQARDYRTELKFVSSSGNILKHRSQWAQQLAKTVYPIFSKDILPNLKISPPPLKTAAVEREASFPSLTADLSPSLSGAENWMTPAMRMYLWKHGAGPGTNYYGF